MIGILHLHSENRVFEDNEAVFKAFNTELAYVSPSVFIFFIYFKRFMFCLFIKDFVKATVSFLEKDPSQALIIIRRILTYFPGAQSKKVPIRPSISIFYIN